MMGTEAPAGKKSNIVLVGMPGSGKSTVGVLLAKYTERDFVDTDVLIQIQEGRRLQQIVDSEGYMALRAIEERILLSLRCSNHVIATGGSAVYSVAAMSRLKINGVIFFLDVEFEEIQERVHDFETRGIARRPDQTFRDLYDERHPLYLKYADIIIECGTQTQEQIASIALARLAQSFHRGVPE